MVYSVQCLVVAGLLLLLSTVALLVLSSKVFSPVVVVWSDVVSVQHFSNWMFLISGAVCSVWCA